MSDLSIVITTCIQNLDITVPVLLDSIALSVQNLPQPKSIIIVCGDESLAEARTETYIRPNISVPMTIIYVPHNSIDFTGLIAIYEKIITGIERFFYMHDTCKVGESFWRLLLEIQPLEQGQTMSFPFPSMNIGLYTMDSLTQHGGLLESMKKPKDRSIQEWKTLNVKKEDLLFRQNQSRHKTFSGQLINHDPVDFYKLGTLRIIEYYTGLDFYKIKANYTGKSVWTITP